GQNRRWQAKSLKSLRFRTGLPPQFGGEDTGRPCKGLREGNGGSYIGGQRRRPSTDEVLALARVDAGGGQRRRPSTDQVLPWRELMPEAGKGAGQACKGNRPRRAGRHGSHKDHRRAEAQ